MLGALEEEEGQTLLLLLLLLLPGLLADDSCNFHEELLYVGSEDSSMASGWVGPAGMGAEEASGTARLQSARLRPPALATAA